VYRTAGAGDLRGRRLGLASRMRPRMRRRREGAPRSTLRSPSRLAHPVVSPHEGVCPTSGGIMAGVNGAVVAVTRTIRGRSTSRITTCTALPRQQRCDDLPLIARVSARNRAWVSCSIGRLRAHDRRDGARRRDVHLDHHPRPICALLLQTLARGRGSSPHTGLSAHLPYRHEARDRGRCTRCTRCTRCGRSEPG
jgi:hypothetical protein